MISQDSKKGLHNPWVLGVIGLIVVVLCVNGALIWYAAHHRSALVDRDYNTRNRKSDAAAMSDIQVRRALGWQVGIRQHGTIVTDVPAAYEISIMDRDGRPVSGALEVEAYRAADASKDFTTAFTEVSAGNYQGAISFPLKGYWELRIRVKRGEDVFETGTGRFMISSSQ